MKNIKQWFTLILFITTFISPSLLASSIELLLAQAALQRTEFEVSYDGAYVKLDYPNGDVPANTGVCTDVVIRSYRALGVDLQKLVHEDMRSNFSEYPSKRIWGLTRPDKNIDHRRVPNLQAYFSRFATTIPVTEKPADYLVGDIVTWMLPGNFPHIGIVAEQATHSGLNPLIVHNIGAGPQLEDMLFDYKITGHYRFNPENVQP